LDLLGFYVLQRAYLASAVGFRLGLRRDQTVCRLIEDFTFDVFAKQFKILNERGVIAVGLFGD
jgi:hypothetical protein